MLLRISDIEVATRNAEHYLVVSLYLNHCFLQISGLSEMFFCITRYRKYNAVFIRLFISFRSRIEIFMKQLRFILIAH